MLIYARCWEPMNSVGSHGSLSSPFVMKVMMVCRFESDSPEVMTALVVVLPLIVGVEISLQLHRSFIQGLSPPPVLLTSLLVKIRHPWRSRCGRNPDTWRPEIETPSESRTNLPAASSRWRSLRTGEFLFTILCLSS